jgi:hypothetical protein
LHQQQLDHLLQRKQQLSQQRTSPKPGRTAISP